MTLTTASVERGFSRVKLIKTKTRSTMTIDTLHCLKNLKLSGKLIDQFDYERAKHFWSKKSRRIFILTKYNKPSEGQSNE